MSFCVCDFQHAGRGCYAKSTHYTTDCTALGKKTGGRAMGTHFSQTHPVIQKHNRQQVLLSPSWSCSTQFHLRTHFKEKGRRIFQWTELHQLIAYKFFIRIFWFTEFLTGSNNKAIAGNYFKISIYIFEFKISSLANLLFWWPAKVDLN